MSAELQHQVRPDLFLCAGERGLIAKRWGVSLSLTCEHATHVHDLSEAELVYLLQSAISVAFACRDVRHTVSLTRDEAMAAVKALEPHLPPLLQGLPGWVEGTVMP